MFRNKQAINFVYWRPQRRLSGFMLNKLIERGGKRDSFDAFYLIITPAILTVGFMLISYFFVGFILYIDASIIMGSVVGGILATVFVLVLPPFSIGILVGYLRGIHILSAISTAVAPIIYFMLSLHAFQGPTLTPLANPTLTVASMLGWTTLATVGMALGKRLPGRFNHF